jgi:hypothetical protein
VDRFAGDQIELSELVQAALWREALMRGLELPEMGWGVESERVRELMRSRAGRVADIQEEAVPRSLGVAEPVFS